MAATTALKAPQQPCKGCDTTIPAQPRGPGRPREFCSCSCRRAYFHRQEKAELERQRQRQWAEEWERRTFQMDQWHHGTREARRRAKLRARGES